MSGETDIRLVAALGNPGQKYARTRHNIAWQVVEALSFYDELDWQEKFKGIYSDYRMPGVFEKIFFLEPWTYMNLSGQSLVAMMQFFKIQMDHVLVVHDELELEFGTIGFKRGGGLGGHNGLRSIASSLGTRDFKRLRLGISRPSHGDISNYVLSPFSRDEEPILPTYIEESAALLENCLSNSFDSLEKSHRKKKIIQEQI
ncbi:MAG: aminoacyl-tRNA hydrolase [bacterium]|nr:aminoacyl-tRNA hydrolase [bacterium]